MVYISKVYTRSGDAGQTRLATGRMVHKDDERVEAYGDVDELNAVLGLVRLEIQRSPSPHRAALAALEDELSRIQQELFNLGGELATPNADGSSTVSVQERHVGRLEQEIDRWNEDLEPLRSFVLPAGGPVTTACHLARTVCRRAERRVVRLTRSDAGHGPVRSECLRYLNRLSDYLFVVARAAARATQTPEVLWDPTRT